MECWKISLKAARNNADMTQRETAKALGISPATYGAWEKDPSKISALRQSELSGLFNIPIDRINFLPET